MRKPVESLACERKRASDCQLPGLASMRGLASSACAEGGIRTDRERKRRMRRPAPKLVSLYRMGLPHPRLLRMGPLRLRLLLLLRPHMALQPEAGMIQQETGSLELEMPPVMKERACHLPLQSRLR